MVFTYHYTVFHQSVLSYLVNLILSFALGLCIRERKLKTLTRLYSSIVKRRSGLRHSFCWQPSRSKSVVSHNKSTASAHWFSFLFHLWFVKWGYSIKGLYKVSRPGFNPCVVFLFVALFATMRKKKSQIHWERNII